MNSITYLWPTTLTVSWLKLYAKVLAACSSPEYTVENPAIMSVLNN